MKQLKKYIRIDDFLFISLTSRNVLMLLSFDNFKTIVRQDMNTVLII